MPYRQTRSRETLVEALSAARLNIANEAPDIDALRAEEARLVREIAALGLPKVRASIPFSEWSRVRVASPCHEDWNAMQGEGAVRRCTRCERDVYNLSGMTSLGVKALLGERGEAPCVRFYRRPDGTLLTSDCDAPLGKSRVVLRVLAAAACTVAAAGAIAYAEAHSGRATVPIYVRTVSYQTTYTTFMGLLQSAEPEAEASAPDDSLAALDGYESEQDDE